MERNLLVLDLDETLIHVTTRPDIGREPDTTIHGWPLYCRPYLQEFLDYCFANFRVGVWTSASRSYAKGIIHKTFEGRTPEFLWWDERCTTHFDPELLTSYPVKDIRKLKREGYKLESILAIDDTPEKWQRSYGNYLRVHPFKGTDDDELRLLIKYLPSLKSCSDLRRIEKRWWRDSI